MQNHCQLFAIVIKMDVQMQEFHVQFLTIINVIYYVMELIHVFKLKFMQYKSYKLFKYYMY